MIERCIAFVNGKGGVGKSSCAANVAGTAALSGWRTLLVDMDPQGNLGRDLGYRDQEFDDGGQALLNAVLSSEAPTVRLTARENLDVLPAGDRTVDLEAILRTRSEHDDGGILFVATALQLLAPSYDLIVIDTPPATKASKLVGAALAAARHVVIPTRGDAASLDGLVQAAELCSKTRLKINPHLNVLGVILFNLGLNDRALISKARGQLEAALPSDVPVFEAFVRNSRKAPDDMRERGQLAYEYEHGAQQATAYWQAKRDGAPIERFSASAEGLASDYHRVTTEILGAMQALESSHD